MLKEFRGTLPFLNGTEQLLQLLHGNLQTVSVAFVVAEAAIRHLRAGLPTAS